MAIVTCQSCMRNVLPMNDGRCPSCQSATDGAPPVPIERTSSEEVAAWQRYREEQGERQAAARQLNARASQLTIGGIALAAAGALVTLATMLSAEPGGRYVIWSGAVVAGIGMFARGRSMRDAAMKLED